MVDWPQSATEQVIVAQLLGQGLIARAPDPAAGI